MKKIFNNILPLSVLLLAACNSEENLLVEPSSQQENPSVVTKDSILEGVTVSLPELIDGNAVNDGENADVATRSTLIYDLTAKKTLFSWGENDADAYTCVFPLNKDVTEAPKDEVTPQVFTRRAGQSTTALNSSFEGPNGIRALAQKDDEGDIINYISFRPYTIAKSGDYYNAKELSYQSNSISYEGQCNSAIAKIKAYRENTDSYAAYNESEKAAASHIGAYDYLVSEPTTATEEGSVFFNLKRVGVSARFYLKCPAAEVFEQLELVTKNTELFTLEGTMDLSSMNVTDDDQSITITPTKQSNVITLSYDYNAKDEENHPGLDMTDTSGDYYYKGVGYIISYMMLPPVDLSTAVPSGSTNSAYLYLVSHTKTDPTVKKYYKSTALKLPKLTSNMFYQWTSANNNDTKTPITFSEVTVQQWQDDTSVDNGDDGTGTEGW